MHLFVFGNTNNLRVTDSQNAQHRLIKISGSDGGFQEVSVYCPGAECWIDATGSTERILFSEPKEMGAISLAAVLLIDKSRPVIFLGLFGVFSSFILRLLKLLCERQSAIQNECYEKGYPQRRSQETNMFDTMVCNNVSNENSRR